jgi:hypothetical protein
MSWDAFAEWAAGNWEWAVALVGGLAAFRRKRIVSIVTEEFNPQQIHKVLADVQTTVNKLDEKVDGLTEHVFFLSGRVSGEAPVRPIDPKDARIPVKR